MMIIQEGKHTQFSQREDGIYVIEVNSSSPDIANEMVAYFEVLAVQTVDLHRILIDLNKTGNNHPLSQSFSKMRHVMQRYPNRPKAWIAVITKGSAMTSLINTLMSIMVRRGERFRLFPESQRQEVWEWLHHED
jgi:50S ribosomal subunit-associated GTPase HflX